MITDKEIQAALERVASRAPDPSRVRAGLDARARVHRQRRALLVAGGAVATASVLGLPAAALWLDTAGQDAAGAPDDVPVEPDVRTAPNLGAAMPEPAAAPGNLRIPLRYRPTWLPEGYVEASREASLRGGAPDYQVREWMRAEDAATMPDGNHDRAPFVRLMLVSASEWPIGDWRLPVTVNGVAGGLSPKEGQTPQVVWPVAEGLQLATMVQGVGDDSLVAQWVARSVEADSVTAVDSPLDFGWLPDSIQGSHRIAVSYPAETWTATLSVIRDRQQVAGAVLGPAVTAPSADGSPASVRGRQGLVHSFDTGGGWAYVELAQGMRLAVTVMQPTSREELLRVIAELKIGTTPYLGWLGRR
ncbi:hypothetical protein [Dactylosporangium sp. NPDC048998]|uniref:hypothetical protein n=1 Tax=Dactylosporangium sp. NPDC048998 TaxID=3363976 RepID=UPI0037211A6C